jgi:hypothetical protein
VLFRFEKIEERLSDLRGRHHLKREKFSKNKLRARAEVLVPRAKPAMMFCQLSEQKFFKNFFLRIFAWKRIKESEVSDAL